MAFTNKAACRCVKHTASIKVGNNKYCSIHKEISLHVRETASKRAGNNSCGTHNEFNDLFKEFNEFASC